MPWPHDTEGQCDAVALLMHLMDTTQLRAPEPERTILTMLILECWFHDVHQGGMTAAQHCARLQAARVWIDAAEPNWHAAIEEMEHGSGGGNIDDPVSEPAERAIQYLFMLIQRYGWDAQKAWEIIQKYGKRKRKKYAARPQRWGRKNPFKNDKKDKNDKDKK